MIDNAKQNWKTTTAGVLTILVGVVSIVINVLKGNAITVNDLSGLLAALTVGAGLIHASDGKVDPPAPPQ